MLGLPAEQPQVQLGQLLKLLRLLLLLLSLPVTAAGLNGLLLLLLSHVVGAKETVVLGAAFHCCYCCLGYLCGASTGYANQRWSM